MESWGCFGLKKDSQKQMPKIDFSKNGENTYFKTHNRLFFAHFFNRRRIWEPLLVIESLINMICGITSLQGRRWACMQSCRRGHNCSSSSVQVLHSLISYYLPTTQWIVDTLICLASTLFKLCSKLSTESEFYLCWDVTFVKSFAKYALPKTFLAF